MTTNVPLTDAVIEATLARRAARVDGTGLHDQIMAGIATTPQSRRPLVAWSGWATSPAPSLRLAWLLLGAILLLAVTGIVLVAGSSPRSLPRHPQALVAPGVEALASGPAASTGVVAGSDGMVWAYTRGHLVRLDPATGVTRTWTAADDAAFADPVLAPAAGGGVWLVGGDELRWFDGERFRDVVPAPPGVTSIRAGAESPDGTLWVSAGGRGLLRWDGRAWTSAAWLPRNVVAGTVAVDSGGRAWVAGLTSPGPVSAGVWRTDGSHWTSFTERDAAVLGGTVSSIATAPDGSVWVGSDVGITHFDGTSWASFGAAQLGAAGSWSVAVGPDGVVWAATGEATNGVGIARFDGASWTLFGSADGLPWPDASGISDAQVAASTNGVSASTNAGIYRLAGGRWERAWPLDGEATVPLLDLAAVSGGEAWGLWVGAWGAWGANEIWHFRDGGWSRDASAEGVPPGVRDLALAPDGTLWAATSHGLAARIDSTWTIVDERPARGVAVAPDGTVLTGGEGSKAWTVRRASAGWEVRDLPDAAPGSLTTSWGTPWTFGPAMAVDRAGHLWAAGGSQGWLDAPGLLRFDGERWELMRPVEEAGSTVFGNVVAALDGAVWVTIDATSSSAGCCTPASPATQVARFAGGRWTVFGTADGLPSDNVGLGLAVGPDGGAWLSTTQGLFRFDGERWTLRFGGHDFGRLAAAPDGTLWASGQGGVVRIEPGAADAEPSGG